MSLSHCISPLAPNTSDLLEADILNRLLASKTLEVVGDAYDANDDTMENRPGRRQDVRDDWSDWHCGECLTTSIDKNPLSLSSFFSDCCLSMI